MTQPARTSHPSAHQAPVPNTLKGESTQRCYSTQQPPDDTVEAQLSEAKKFELLSAYIDNEVSEEERQMVEGWLASDPTMRQKYKAQLKLSQAMKSLLG